MYQFKSWQSYWDFETKVRNESRYHFDKDTDEFLFTVLKSAKRRIGKLNKGDHLWRAQLGNDLRPHYQDGEYVDDFPTPLEPKRMKPLKDKAKEGRLNPKGIPYLYLATHQDTAMSEVRPWIGAHISLGQFEIVRKLKIVVCALDFQEEIFSVYEMPPVQREKVVWNYINRAFSEPVTPQDNDAAYIPTQILAELFKTNGYDGVAYKSPLGEDGHNVALFDINDARIINNTVYEVENIKFKFEQSSGRSVYFGY